MYVCTESRKSRQQRDVTCIGDCRSHDEHKIRRTTPNVSGGSSSLVCMHLLREEREEDMQSSWSVRRTAEDNGRDHAHISEEGGELIAIELCS